MSPDEHVAELRQRNATSQYRPLTDSEDDEVVYADEGEWADEYDDED